MLSITSRLLVAFFILIGQLFSYSYAGVNQHDLRERYRAWNDTRASMDIAAQLELLTSLQEYSLYPYAKYQFLKENIQTVSTEEVKSFIAEYADIYLATDLQRLYAQELTNREEWGSLVAFPLDRSIGSQCNYLFALSKRNETTKALAPVKNLWLTGQELPSVCDNLLDVWQESGQKTANLVLLRIELALKANNLRLARYLTVQLPDNYKTVRSALQELFNDPKQLVNFSNTITPSAFTRSIVMSSFSRFARVDPENAKTIIPVLVKRQQLSKANEKTLMESVSWQFFSANTTDAQIKWRDNIIAKSSSIALVERRVRQALWQNNQQDLAIWLNKLPPAAKQKDEWQYWQAELLFKQGKVAEADKILTRLVDNRGFYAMLSAQKLNVPYDFDFNYSVIDSASPQIELALLKDQFEQEPAIVRIKELRYWQMNALASREWRGLIYKQQNRHRLAELARYAYSQGWAEHSVQATIAGKLWNNWVERFPLAYLDIFEDAITDKDIPLSYALAISRQESALEPSVQSPAGARGLMQLMPGTAKDSAKKLDGIEYNSAEQLFEPGINIPLGTYYLEYVYQLFEHNRILASAAYNAGPTRVKRWLAETNGQLETIAFIESIPFTETRNYVKSVLVYDYIYQLILKNSSSDFLTTEELMKRY